MTTSRDHRKPTSFATHGDHWLDLTARLSRESTDQFGGWLEAELALLEVELDAFVTPRSRGKRLRRQAQDPVS